MDIRKLLVIVVIAVLFSILVFTTIDAIYPQPDYEDFCKYDRIGLEKPFIETNCDAVPIGDEEIKNCVDQDGTIKYTYDSNGCATEYRCDFCENEYDTARQEYAFIVFLVSAIASLIAIVLGLWLPTSNTINEWIGTGFMLGGIISLFFGTVRYFGDLNRTIRPIVIFLELLIVLYVTYKKLGPSIDKKKR